MIQLYFYQSVYIALHVPNLEILEIHSQHYYDPCYNGYVQGVIRDRPANIPGGLANSGYGMFEIFL